MNREIDLAGRPQLFASLSRSRPLTVPEEAREDAARALHASDLQTTFLSGVDERMLDVFNRASNPEDPLELRDLWLARIEHELGPRSGRPRSTGRWQASRPHRRLTSDDVLRSNATVRFVKELFNWFFRDDLYGELRSGDHLILSSGAVDEEAWGLPEALKECVRYALARDWYGYSDSRGRIPAREAVAAFETARIEGAAYSADNVALTMGGTFAISSLADFIFMGAPRSGVPALCAIPNYPPLVEAIARRRNVQLVPLSSKGGVVSLEPLIAALTPQTPLVLLQTVANPTGAEVLEADLERLIRAAAPSTLILLDECHEWLGPPKLVSPTRAASHVIRVSSLSKLCSAPGLKLGWILADAALIADYYEYASTTFGGPPSFFYTLIEVFARMERWLMSGMELPGASEMNEFEGGYHIELDRLRHAYSSYRRERMARQEGLMTLRDAAVARLSEASASVIPPVYSINITVELADWNDSYRCFRDLLQEAQVSVYPGILAFCLSGGFVRITTSRRWVDLTTAITRLDSALRRERQLSAAR